MFRLLVTIFAFMVVAPANAQLIDAAYGADKTATPYKTRAATQDISDEQSPAPVFVELFTSQSCSSCPAAEALFVGLAARPDLVTVEWHVDYWNDLTLARAGNWRDPFSSAANTARQRTYNTRIRGRTGVYTPQAVVNGSFETVGSKARAIARLIEHERARQSVGASLDVAPRDGTALSVSAAAPPDTAADIFVIDFMNAMETPVRGGENKGLVLREAHIATGIKRVAALTPGQRTTMSIDMPEKGNNCAVILQEPNAGAILAARYCQPGNR